MLDHEAKGGIYAAVLEELFLKAIELEGGLVQADAFCTEVSLAFYVVDVAMAGSMRGYISQSQDLSLPAPWLRYHHTNLAIA